MKIANDKVVQFNFSISETGKDGFLQKNDDHPAMYLHGHNNIFSKVEEVLLGKEAGAKVDVTLLPNEAYGEIDERDPVRVPRKHIATKGKLTKGQVVVVNTTDGMQESTVVKVGLKSVDIDPNHPLAGMSLDFKLEVVDVRDATQEEISHGHGHGEGGHHH